MKKMICFFITLSVLLWCFDVLSQDIPVISKVTIRGKLLDSLNKEPVAYLAGYAQVDSIQVTFITDAKGSFTIEMPPSANIVIIVKSQFYQYLEQSVPLNAGTQPIVFILKPSEFLLKEIEVSGKHPVVKEIDKLTYKFKDSQAQLALSTLICEVSTVTKGKDGITVKGTKKAKVYLDGKLVSEDVLQNLLAINIEKVEVIEHPPFSEMVDVDVTLINIVGKKNSENSVFNNTNIDVGFLRPFYSSDNGLIDLLHERDTSCTHTTC